MELKEKRKWRDMLTGEIYVISIYECGACMYNGKWYTEYSNARARVRKDSDKHPLERIKD